MIPKIHWKERRLQGLWFGNPDVERTVGRKSGACRCPVRPMPEQLIDCFGRLVSNSLASVWLAWGTRMVLAQQETITVKQYPA